MHTHLTGLKISGAAIDEVADRELRELQRRDRPYRGAPSARDWRSHSYSGGAWHRL